MESSDIKIAVHEGVVYIHVIGRGIWEKSRLLKDFLFEMIGKGYHDLRIDLSECSYIDSTFIGTLVAVTLKLQASACSAITVIGSQPQIRKSLDTMGVSKLLNYSEQPLPCAPVETASLGHTQQSKLDDLKHMLDAHIILESLDAVNASKFQNLKDILKEAIAKEEKELGI